MTGGEAHALPENLVEMILDEYRVDLLAAVDRAIYITEPVPISAPPVVYRTLEHPALTTELARLVTAHVITIARAVGGPAYHGSRTPETHPYLSHQFLSRLTLTAAMHPDWFTRPHLDWLASQMILRGVTAP